MRYDFTLIDELCRELRLECHIRSAELHEIELSQGVALCFQNLEPDEDCYIGARGTPWHLHEDFMFTEARGYYTELNYLDLLTGLKEGKILVCEQWRESKLTNRWLVHRECNDEFKHVQEGEEIRGWSPMTLHPETS